MKHIVLCGGSGSRLSTSTGFPKPLNLVLGAPSIRRVVESIPSTEVYVFMNHSLKAVELDTVLPHLVSKNVHIVTIDRPTRGAVETAYLGLLKVGFPEDTPLCFYDNDTVYTTPTIPSATFIGVSKLTTTDYRPYCFLTAESGVVTQIAEKIQISDIYACGVYGFEKSSVFLCAARKVLCSGTNYNHEFYMSIVYNQLIREGTAVRAIEVAGICAGTPEDIRENRDRLPPTPLRVCFDLDNTVFKYRQGGQGYADCDPIEHVVFYLRELKKMGHTVILQTARGMKTHHNDLGRVMRNIAADTFDSLAKHEIPYDEVYFGKPAADLYIDDRAFNPYIDLYAATGFGHLTEAFARSKIPASSSNRFNLVYRIGPDIVKQGPSDSMAGEVFFYSTVRKTPIASLFPQMRSSAKNGERTEMRLQYIDGFTLHALQRDGLLTPNHLLSLLEKLSQMHEYSGIPITISADQLYQNYMGKLWKRIQNREDYPFDDVAETVAQIDRGVRDYLARAQVAAVVHGDPWFSNTLMTPKGDIVFLDMKGDIAGTLTTNGDALTDFGKIYQSLLGFDFFLDGESPPDSLRELEGVFLQEMERRGFQPQDLRTVTACLISKTLAFLTVGPDVRKSIWGIVQSLL